MCSFRHITPASVKPLSCGFLEATSPRSIPARSDRARNDMPSLAILVVTCLCCPPLAHAQSIAPDTDTARARTYHLLREDDDWRFLAGLSEREDFWDPVKYI